MTPLLTIGIPVFDDTDACIFTLQHLRTVHDLRNKEIVIVDNNPTSAKGQKLKEFCEKLYNEKSNELHGLYGVNTCPVRYIAMPDPKGTSAPRNKIFEEARGEFTLVMDSHVFLMPNAIKYLEEYYNSNPMTSDLITGPIMFDELDHGATHFADMWRGEMWGTWSQAWACSCRGTRTTADPSIENKPLLFDTQEGNEGMLQYCRVGYGRDQVTVCPACGKVLPILNYYGHQTELVKNGYHPLGTRDTDPPFQIPGMGMGLFTCRTAAWEGFHPDATEFGGEEMWYSQKVELHGHRHLCLPGLRWWHKFNRDSGIPYPIHTYTKARNYVLEFMQIGKDLAPIYDHFVLGLELPSRKPDKHFETFPKLGEAEWNHLLADPYKHKLPPEKTMPIVSRIIPGMTNPKLESLYDWAYQGQGKRDVYEHFPIMREYGEKCKYVTLITKRRETEIPFLACHSVEKVTSFTSEPDSLHSLIKMSAESESKSFDVIPVQPEDVIVPIETDLLYIHSTHTDEAVYEQLSSFKGKINKYIVLQSTDAFGLKGEGSEKSGILVGALRYIEENPLEGWFRTYTSKAQYGLTVFSRVQGDPDLAFGPGTELGILLAGLSIVPASACDCKAKAMQMDDWGVAGCKEPAKYDWIIRELKAGQVRWGWAAKFKAAALAVWQGFAFKVDPLDPVPGLVDEAIRRAERRVTTPQATP